MVFRRRIPKTYAQLAQEAVYPRGGWIRAATYIWHRLSRLPDQPHRIGRGVAAGIFISFTPLFGLHFIGGGAIGWLIRGNILAALTGTFFGNPVTLPFIAVSSIEVGSYILGARGGFAFPTVVEAFSRATVDLWDNARAIFSPADMHWSGLVLFFHDIFLPYLVGGCVLGVIVGAMGHYATLPFVGAYQRRRLKKLRDRAEKLRAGARARAEGMEDAAAAHPPAQPSSASH